jgi:hypothetical protein
MGAICKYCNQDMREADGCVKMPIKLKDGRKLVTLFPAVVNHKNTPVELTLQSVMIAPQN